MKQSKQSFFSSVITVALVLSFVITAGAATLNLLYNQINVSLQGQQKITAGETETGQNGAELPTSISYVDEKGGTTNYLSVRQLSDILDADLYWDVASKTVVLGRSAPISTGGSSITLPDGTILGQTPSEKQEADDLTPFREVDIKQPKTAGRTSYPLPLSRFQSKMAFSFERAFHVGPNGGKYVNITVTNHNTTSSEPVYFSLYRAKTIGEDLWSPSVAVAPGKTVTRTFEIAPDANPLAYELGVYVTPHVENYQTDVSVEVIHFD